jgi:cytochrome P450
MRTTPSSRTKANVKRSKFYDTWSCDADDVNALMTSDVEVHARKRRLLNLAFTDHSAKAASSFIAKHIDRWNEPLLDSKGEEDEGWSSPREMTSWTRYLVFDILMDSCFGAAMDTKEPGDNPFRKIPQAFDDFASCNYPVSRGFCAEFHRFHRMSFDASFR